MDARDLVKKKTLARPFSRAEENCRTGERYPTNFAGMEASSMRARVFYHRTTSSSPNSYQMIVEECGISPCAGTHFAPGMH